MDIAPLVRRGLGSTPKSLPPVLFYDKRGSDLFEQITRLPEYYLTRTERGILRHNAAGILRHANGSGPLTVVELGAGTAQKTDELLAPLVSEQGTAMYIPIDVSPDPLQQASKRLAAIDGLSVQPIAGDNLAALQSLPPSGPARLILFLGSSIGNFEPDQAKRFLGRIAGLMRRQDALLLGTDLVKDAATLERAYNDAAGVTAQFNLNALVRLNQEFAGDFEVASFDHDAFYNAGQGRVEMHLVSRHSQEATVRALDARVSLAEGESIHTENSYKYTQPQVEALAAAAGLRPTAGWTDDAHWFALTLLSKPA